MRRVRDPLAAGLVRAIRACLDGSAAIEEGEVRPWASATFVGAVYRFAVDLAGEAEAAALAAALEAHEFALNGNLVADLAFTRRRLAGGGARLEIEVLTVEE